MTRNLNVVESFPLMQPVTFYVK